MRAAFQLVRVFAHKESAAGNRAAIFLDSSETVSQEELARLSADTYAKTGVPVTCFVSQVVNEHCNVKCFNVHHPIQCCGHGMMAAAKILFTRNNLFNIIFNKNIAVSIKTNTSGQEVVRIKLPRLTAKSQDLPKWTSGLITFGEKIIEPNLSAVSDKIDGYILFEFKPRIMLEVFRAFQLNLNKVCDNTQRGIAIVQFDKSNSLLFLRYFAPQYGVREDSATGSVMRFVADYIENKYHISQFEVNQCSEQGGFMSIECKTNSILITANATIEAG